MKDLPLFVGEGFSLDHGGNAITSWHVDFRKHDERTPIGAVIKYGQAKYAIERSRTIQLARPSYFRQEGETLIYDRNEGLVTEEIVERRMAIAKDVVHHPHRPGDLYLQVGVRTFGFTAPLWSQHPTLREERCWNHLTRPTTMSRIFQALARSRRCSDGHTLRNTTLLTTK